MKTAPIKVFVDAHVFDGAFQGTTTYLAGLYTHLVKQEDFEITLAAHEPGRLKLVFTDPRFRFVKLESPSKYKRLAFEIPALLKAGKYDYAHFQYITPFRKPCRYINTIHDILFIDFPQYFPFAYRFTKKHIFRLSAWRSDLICTVSDYSREALIRHFGIRENRLLLTPNAVEPPAEPVADVKQRYGLDKYILFVSRMEPRKNHYLMLKSFVELALFGKGYQLVFIGRKEDVRTDNYHTYYQSIPEAAKEAVLHLENISPAELNSFYRNAELFVYPSLAEGFGIPPLEAAIMGCKVLCSNQTAMSDFDFFGPYLFDPNNPEELKLKIQSILEDENYPYAEIRAAVLNRYNWSRISADFAARLRSMGPGTH